MFYTLVRDRKIAEVDQKIKHKILKKTVTKLGQDIHISRDKLTNAIEGDPHALRYALSGFKDLQLMYQNQPIQVKASIAINPTFLTVNIFRKSSKVLLNETLTLENLEIG